MSDGCEFFSKTLILDLVGNFVMDYGSFRGYGLTQVVVDGNMIWVVRMI